jgi:hypothetical protein
MKFEMSQERHEAHTPNVFDKRFTGGPLGLGDPEDRTLRHVEETVYIVQIVKDRAHREKCKDFVESLYLFQTS